LIVESNNGLMLNPETKKGCWLTLVSYIGIVRAQQYAEGRIIDFMFSSNTIITIDN